MEDNIENIPESVLNCLEAKSFSALSPEEREQVTRFFSPEAYHALHLTIRGIKQGTPAPSQNRKAEIRRQLMEQFDTLHGTEKRLETRWIFLTQVPFWRAAAMLFLASTTWLSYWFSDRDPEKLPLGSVKNDTVYVVKEVLSPPVLRVDTFFVQPKKPFPGSRKPENAKLLVLEDTAPMATPVAIPGLDPLPVLPQADWENRANNPKNNSLSDDSLLKHLPVVSL